MFKRSSEQNFFYEYERICITNKIKISDYMTKSIGTLYK